MFCGGNIKKMNTYKNDVSYRKYDFLDGEIYYIVKSASAFSKLYLNTESGSADSGKSLIMHNYKGKNQKFKFEWLDSGYKIHALGNENIVLTLHLNDDGSCYVHMDKDLNLQEQLWEVLPYNNETAESGRKKGLVIRSKVLCYKDGEDVGMPLYLSYENNRISVSTDRLNNTAFMIFPISDWTRFGYAYMRYISWIGASDNKIKRAMTNYEHNLKNGIGKSNIFRYNSAEVLLNQNHGEFPNLFFGSNVPMNRVICEVIATYNALKLKGNLIDDASYRKFFRLAVEFELNAMKMTPPFGKYRADGSFGSEPRKIGKCLQAYNVKYDKFDRKALFGRRTSAIESAKDMNSKLKADDILIMAYNFGTLNLQIHTFSGRTNISGRIDLLNEDCTKDSPTLVNSVGEITNTSEKSFRVGYILR